MVPKPGMGIQIQVSALHFCNLKTVGSRRFSRFTFRSREEAEAILP
jgi:hypothetical protein